jgi:uncharacterized protein YjbI with pentapeptide repeats
MHLMSKPRQRSSHLTSPSEKNNGDATSSPATATQIPGPRPALDDQDGWKAYWAARGQPWRTEPEIDAKRQAELNQHRAIVPDVRQGMYPFKGMKLSRADIECLLAAHENGRGPVDWSDEGQRERKGLDLRGTDLRQADLHGLPLARVYCGLTNDEQQWASEGQCMMARAHLGGAILDYAHLQGAELHHVCLEAAQFQDTHLEQAQLVDAQLQGTCLGRVYFQQANLTRAALDKSTLNEVELSETNLREAKLEGASVKHLKLGDRDYLGPFVADAQWTGVNLAVIDWSHEVILGDEQSASQKSVAGKKKTSSSRLAEHEGAVRANRQFAAALQAQGLNEEAKPFAYRAQVLQRNVFWFRMTQHSSSWRKWIGFLGAWLFSWFLFLIAGYGYKPGRSFLAYLLMISGFATTYYVLGHTVGPTLSPLSAFVFSMTSFHGRGFVPGNNISLDDPLTVLAALEALVGLIIEVTFIATLTQRFFNR